MEPVLREKRLYCVPSFKEDLMAELKVFPDAPKKDILDALSMGIQESQVPEHPTKKRKKRFKQMLERGRVNETTGY